MTYDAVYAGLEHFEQHADYMRTGNHRAAVNGRETGQWHKAALTAVSWLEHLSRDGDMRLHVHNHLAHDQPAPAARSRGRPTEAGLLQAVSPRQARKACRCRNIRAEWHA